MRIRPIVALAGPSTDVPDSASQERYGLGYLRVR